MKQSPIFDYHKEPSRDILCIDCKSFYASCEAASLGLDPLKVKLVVMSYPSDSTRKRGSGLILASSPSAKKAYGITNVSRARDLPFPYPKDLVIVAPRMNHYMHVNRKINNIFRTFVDDANIAVYSVDETFLDVTDSLSYFKCDSAYELARIIQRKVFSETGIYTTIGIGENPLLAKLALDNEAKDNPDMKAEWRYEDVEYKLWNIDTMTDFWGIGHRTAKRLNKLGIYSIRELAHSNFYRLKKEMGVLGAQLYAHAWGIDRTFLGEDYAPKSKSVGNSQILIKDYDKRSEIEIVVREMADQVATRLRKDDKLTTCVSLWVGYSLTYKDAAGRSGFSKQLTIDATNTSKKITEAVLRIFNQYYDKQVVRNIGISCSKLEEPTRQQLNLFEDIKETDRNKKFDEVVDQVRRKYGFTKMIYTSSLMEGGRAIARSSLVGGHAGGMAGIEGKSDEED
ncbi:Y-family DNA polymerase [Erysipelothrix sp. HDW6C]|uniref:Y-family DNA polymerase n=1 Tax=Erysipelothrix sp. HDW6C TaxID=2714930 RepID=UPI00140E5EFA|nr:Y-family DNA polymerase [Erysipelothrix sp. HDW6C]QIK68786.1 Y-family DNA polymerase [Erysipelothrix sp. HDW6C]